MGHPASVLLPVSLAVMGTVLARADIELPRTVVANGGGSPGDVTGRRVRTLVDGTLNPGYYNVPVRAEGLAGGIYFCSMRAEGFAETRRLILLR